MSAFRDQIGRVIARDPRYALEAYAFVLESLHLARDRKLREARRAPRTPGARGRKKAASGHVTGRQLRLAARRLALRDYGLLAAAVLGHWGLRSTSDIGAIVYNLIASGDLDKTPSDRREDFDDVFDFDVDFRPAPIADDDPDDDPEPAEAD